MPATFSALKQDNHINRAILTKRLRLNGHVVVNATNGQEGLAQIEADQEFDAILMDIQSAIFSMFARAATYVPAECQY